ncbi:AAA family ATPase [Streptomyces sp. NPDC055186]
MGVLGQPAGDVVGHLAQATVRLAMAPKSNSVIVGIDEAMSEQHPRHRPGHRRSDHRGDRRRYGEGWWEAARTR